MAAAARSELTYGRPLPQPPDPQPSSPTPLPAAQAPPEEGSPVTSLGPEGSFARLADEQGLRPIYLNPVSRAGAMTAKASAFARKEAERRVENELERVRKLDILTEQLRSRGRKIYISETGVIVSEREAVALKRAAEARKAAHDEAAASGTLATSERPPGNTPERYEPLSALAARLPSRLLSSRPMTALSSGLTPSSQLQSPRVRSSPPGPPPKRGPAAERPFPRPDVAVPTTSYLGTFAFSPLAKGASTAGSFGSRRDPAIWGAASLPHLAPGPVNGAEPVKQELSASTSLSQPRATRPTAVTAFGAASPQWHAGLSADEQPQPGLHPTLSTGPFYLPGTSPTKSVRASPTLAQRSTDLAALPAELVAIVRLAFGPSVLARLLTLGTSTAFQTSKSAGSCRPRAGPRPRLALLRALGRCFTTLGLGLRPFLPLVRPASTIV